MDLKLWLVIAASLLTGAALIVVARNMRIPGSPREIAWIRLIGALNLVVGICLIGAAGREMFRGPTGWWHHMGAVPLGVFGIVAGALALTKPRQSTDA